MGRGLIFPGPNVQAQKMYDQCPDQSPAFPGWYACDTDQRLGLDRSLPSTHLHFACFQPSSVPINYPPCSFNEQSHQNPSTSPTGSEKNSQGIFSNTQTLNPTAVLCEPHQNRWQRHYSLIISPYSPYPMLFCDCLM